MSNFAVTDNNSSTIVSKENRLKEIPIGTTYEEADWTFDNLRFWIKRTKYGYWTVCASKMKEAADIPENYKCQIFVDDGKKPTKSLAAAIKRQEENIARSKASIEKRRKQEEEIKPYLPKKKTIQFKFTAEKIVELEVLEDFDPATTPPDYLEYLQNKAYQKIKDNPDTDWKAELVLLE